MKTVLTENDRIEIYYALDSKRHAILKGDYNDDSKVQRPDAMAQRWAEDLKMIMKKIGPDGGGVESEFMAANHTQGRGSA